jgi:hypothetical protein
VSRRLLVQHVRLTARRVVFGEQVVVLRLQPVQRVLIRLQVERALGRLEVRLVLLRAVDLGGDPGERIALGLQFPVDRIALNV